jgi:predicted nucleotidyltransferase
MATEAQKRASAKYDKANTRSVLLKFNTTNDADILTMLDEVENRQGYIKGLIRNDIKGSGDILSVDSIRRMILPVVKKFGIDRVFLFGSYARGEATPQSDIDLVIEGGTAEGLLDFIRLKEAMSESVGKNVDIVERRAVEVNISRSGKRFRSHIERDQVLLYG